MAEGGRFSQSVVDGSDSLFEFECTPCAADGSKLEALDFCPTCDQFLCKTCTKYHQRLSKNHHLVPAGSSLRQTSQADANTSSVVAKCLFHPDRDIEMYCGTHDMVYCLLCIAREHRSCSSVEEIESELHKPDMPKFQQIVADIGFVSKKLLDVKQEKNANLDYVKVKKASLLEEINSARKELNDHLDHLECKVKTELEEEVKKLEQEMLEEIKMANNLLTTVTERNTDLARNTNDTDIFIAEKLGRKITSNVEAFVKKSMSYKRDFKFERNPNFYFDMKMVDSMGKIVRFDTKRQQAQNNKYVVSSYKQIDVMIGTNFAACDIMDMCQLEDGMILVICKMNSKLWRLDDHLNVKDFCDLDFSPAGICVISSTKVVVRSVKRVQFIHVGQSLSPGKKIQLHLPQMSIWHFLNQSRLSIAFCSNSLWTYYENSLYVFSLSGDLVKEIETDSQGRKIFALNKPVDFAVSKDGSKVFVAALGGSVFVFNKNGGFVCELCDHSLRGAYRLCITDDDIVLVAGYKSQNIVMFDRNGLSLGELIRQKEKTLSSPESMCFDRKNCCLLVSYQSGKIHKLHLSK